MAEKEEKLRERLPVNPADVHVDDLMLFLYYGKVAKVDMGGDALMVNNVDLAPGLGQFGVQGHELVRNSLSADRWTQEEKVSRTVLAQKLVEAVNVPFTVVFEKATGETRKLRGRLLAPEPLLGRSHVEDLDIQSGDRIRLVDHRTISLLIVGGVKYVLR